MREFEDVIKSPRLNIEDIDPERKSLKAFLSHPEYKAQEVCIIAGWNEDVKNGIILEHVSVSLNRRCPKWDEMCMIKDIFWDEEELVAEFHRPKSQYVNLHPYCLHLWRKVGWEAEMDWLEEA